MQKVMLIHVPWRPVVKAAVLRWSLMLQLGQSMHVCERNSGFLNYIRQPVGLLNGATAITHYHGIASVLHIFWLYARCPTSAT